MIENKVEDVISDSIDAMGYDIVRIKYNNGTLQVMAERKEDGQLNVDDCAKISRQISSILDVEDFIDENYTLEVSSAGLDRPLVKIGDFEKYAGNDIKLVVKSPVNNQRRYKGKLTGLSDNKDIILQTVNAEEHISFENIESANLIINI